MLEVATAVKEGKAPVDALKETALKYPDIALRLAKKGMNL